MVRREKPGEIKELVQDKIKTPFFLLFNSSTFEYDLTSLNNQLTTPMFLAQCFTHSLLGQH